ncbi:MAG: tRNA lysidine(34) synthetase TilS, partial [Bacteroidales bacterium]|nr:tRNA lysidine(34) synthetase TilS [Bacteroidales bacterium]
LRELYPSFDATLQADIDRFADAGEVYDRYVADLCARLVAEEPSRLPTYHSSLITIQLKELPEPRATLLYELLRPYGFSADSAAAILAKPLRTGSRYRSPSNEAVVDRGRLVVAPLTEPIPPTIAIEEVPTHSSLITQYSSLSISVDADLLRQPLTLRLWRAGDRFCPFGMKQSRLVSDFLKDCKLNLVEKRHVHVLLDAEGRIVWLVGLRADNRFRVTPSTRRILRLTCA